MRSTVRVAGSKRRAPAVLLGLCVALAVSTLPGRAGDTPEAVMDVHATPPLLVPSKADFVNLSFSTACAMPNIEEQCDLVATIHHRPARGEWSTARQPATGLGVSFRLGAPQALYTEYYVEVTERKTGATMLFPEGGAESPLRYYVVPQGKNLQLGSVSAPRQPSDSFRLSWGSAPGEAGLLPGDESATIGPQALDVSEGGDIYLLDQVNERIQVFDRSGVLTNVVPVEVGPLGDIGLTSDGTIFILDRVPQGPGSHPVVHKVAEGTPSTMPPISESRPTLEWEPALLDVVNDVPWVYGTPSDAWAPVFTDSTGLDPRRLDVARPTTVGDVITRVSERTRLDVARVAGEAMETITLRASSNRNFGEIALFEPDQEGGYWLVVRTWQEDPQPWDQHEVVHLAADGRIIGHFALENGEFAETAALSQFRIGRDGRLYQMFSDEAALEIRSFDLN